MLNSTSLAAMGTIADVMELRGENRTLTSFGLSLLSDPKLPGLKALIESADLTGKGLDSYHIGFVAPTLNAAGRIGHARLMEFTSHPFQRRLPSISKAKTPSVSGSNEKFTTTPASL
jgi:single-stranded DNA-specific DHH superfamily exonuclease